MEHRTWLCVCVFWAKISNLCNQTIHQSWRVAFMPQKKVFDFCNEDFRENQFEPQKWMWNWWCLIEICMFEQMAKSERHLFLVKQCTFFCWEFIVFGRIYTWNIYLFSCDCSHFINFMLKTMFFTLVFSLRSIYNLLFIYIHFLFFAFKNGHEGLEMLSSINGKFKQQLSFFRSNCKNNNSNAGDR